MQVGKFLNLILPIGGLKIMRKMIFEIARAISPRYFR